MIKLIDILKEVKLEEKVLKIPQETLNLSKSAYDYINTNYQKLKKRIEVPFASATIPAKFKDYYTVTDRKTGEDRQVSLAIYKDSDDGSDGGVNYINDKLTIIINLAKIEDYGDFVDTIEHELIHLTDPKLTDVDVFQGLEPKDAEPEVDYEKYMKSPREFDAFSSVLINKLKRNLEADSTAGKEAKNKIIQLFQDLANQDLKTVALNPDYKSVQKYFSDKTTEEAILRKFINELGKVQVWTKRPTLYKRFLKRLVTEI